MRFLLAFLCSVTVACGAESPLAPSDPWVQAGEMRCARSLTPSPAVVCDGAAQPGPSRQGIFADGRMTTLEDALSAGRGGLVVTGFGAEQRAAIMQCDLRRFPTALTCAPVGSCQGYDAVHSWEFVEGVVREFVRVGRCW